ncbi:MAG: (dimethylallyl)adenosine tRNA methylthiotransferase [Parcubacteria group bacterium Gr01-1014_18]|nr:MAG: (dimethylallyl)adenosine tRNA methylthiotransferase [Parcubacteria group bacterium Greene0416_36]TSC79793.1 MAG: (dimethylallyl)adenosine tRNA methylthiotransferase [Parcubacteria group bacterium Gr01-1014_18]TSC98077.1 MAG: (dimethylallyl)adenosine tRNA methylthiotransferase [Parcubacteria group bacterium Greene1014_20]TSD06512.1 MAG: (dimethylallyl)adenosine tRNA methylthiotransferase [Parcubacteria group bacterium Greene0714_2]
METKKYHILTLGCQMNKSDSERVDSVLSGLGWTSVDTEDEAALVVVNSCAVRQSAMDRIFGRFKIWNKRRAKGELKVLLTGCVLDQDKKRMMPHVDWFLPIKDLSTLPALLGYPELDLGEYFEVKPNYNNTFSAFVPIMTGCDKFCTFCAVPYTRGREISRPYTQILKEIEQLVRNGCREITLLGQNVNSYVGAPDRTVSDREVRGVGKIIMNLRRRVAGHGGEGQAHRPAPTPVALQGTIDFPQLLQKIADIPGDFWIRFLTSHPYDMSDELVEVMAGNPKICKQLNLPVQSGDDEILKKMNRHYTVEYYLERVRKIRERLPNIALSTDIIVGFCGESDRAFGKTAEVFRAANYDMAFLSEYSTRPGTAAAKLFADDVSGEVKTKRKEELNEILKSQAFSYNQRFMGRTIRVLVDKSEQKGELFLNSGRNEEAKPIQFLAGRDYTGQFVDVEVTKTGAWNLEGILSKFD